MGIEDEHRIDNYITTLKAASVSSGRSKHLTSGLIETKLGINKEEAEDYLEMSRRVKFAYNNQSRRVYKVL